MNKVVNESLCKICHYQQKVTQHYYLLDTLVPRLKILHKYIGRVQITTVYNYLLIIYM